MKLSEFTDGSTTRTMFRFWRKAIKMAALDQYAAQCNTSPTFPRGEFCFSCQWGIFYLVTRMWHHAAPVTLQHVAAMLRSPDSERPGNVGSVDAARAPCNVELLKARRRRGPAGRPEPSCTPGGGASVHPVSHLAAFCWYPPTSTELVHWQSPVNRGGRH